MIGSVSCVIDGVPALFTLDESGIWEVEHRGVDEVFLSYAMMKLMEIVDSYGGPSEGPFGPRQIERAADLLRGTPYLEPKNPPPPGVIH